MSLLAKFLKSSHCWQYLVSSKFHSNLIPGCERSEVGRDYHRLEVNE